MAEEQEKFELVDSKKEAMSALISASSSLFFNVAKFEHAQRVAKVLMASTIVPEHFRNNIGNCVIALNYAERIQADPFMVMQNMYVVHGRPGVEGKLVIALINQSGKYSEPLKFRFDGTGDDYGCTAYTKEAKSGQVVEGPKITVKLVKAEGWDKDKGSQKSKWVTMPDLMYRYRAASWFANTNCPELKLGMSTVEEINDFVDLQQDRNGKYAINTNAEAEKIKTDFFDSLVAGKMAEKTCDSKLDSEKLSEFIKLSAEIQGKTEPEIKAMAQEHFEEFWPQFEAWVNKPTKAKNKKKDEPALSPLGCPDQDNTRMPKETCDNCKARKGCPAWPDESA